MTCVLYTAYCHDKVGMQHHVIYAVTHHSTLSCSVRPYTVYKILTHTLFAEYYVLYYMN
jgi:hypothetical protein